jgi:hypothetical protein
VSGGREPTYGKRVSRLPQVRSLTRELKSKVANTLTAGAFAKIANGNGPVPDDGIAVFFGVGPENGYQLEQWRLPLESLARRRGVFLIVDRADTGRYLLETFNLPIAFARGSGALEVLVERHRVRAVLYVNQVEPNFRMMRFADPVHIQLGHGESDKGGSVSNQHKAYDLTFVGGEAGRDRLAHALYDFDATERIRLVGRPQLDYDYPGAPRWPDDATVRVLYAPTWEGDRPSIRYSSVLTHGRAIVEALRADPRIRIVYRPHPRTGWVSEEHGAADQALRTLLQADGDRHLIDTGPYGWQWGFADACVTDVSAVAYDWLATRKPLIITQPAEEVYLPPSRLLESLPLLAAGRAGDVARQLLDEPQADLLAALTEHYFGDTGERASTRRFEEALDGAIAARAEQIKARAAKVQKG